MTSNQEVFARATDGPHKGYPTPKPCPFCGCVDKLRFEFSGSQGYITCDNCCAMGPCDEKAADPICDMDEAYLAWNRRAHQPAADGEVAELMEWLRKEATSWADLGEVEEFTKTSRAADLLERLQPLPPPT